MTQAFRALTGEEYCLSCTWAIKYHSSLLLQNLGYIRSHICPLQRVLLRLSRRDKQHFLITWETLQSRTGLTFQIVSPHFLHFYSKSTEAEMSLHLCWPCFFHSSNSFLFFFFCLINWMPNILKNNIEKYVLMFPCWTHYLHCICRKTQKCQESVTALNLLNMFY